MDGGTRVMEAGSTNGGSSVFTGSAGNGLGVSNGPSIKPEEPTSSPCSGFFPACLKDVRFAGGVASSVVAGFGSGRFRLALAGFCEVCVGGSFPPCGVEGLRGITHEEFLLRFRVGVDGFRHLLRHVLPPVFRGLRGLRESVLVDLLLGRGAACAGSSHGEVGHWLFKPAFIKRR